MKYITKIGDVKTETRAYGNGISLMFKVERILTDADIEFRSHFDEIIIVKGYEVEKLIEDLRHLTNRLEQYCTIESCNE